MGKEGVSSKQFDAVMRGLLAVPKEKVQKAGAPTSHAKKKARATKTKK